MSEELIQSMKMNLKQRPILEMNSGEKGSPQKPYLTLRLPEELNEHSGEVSSSSSWSHDLRISDNSHSDSNPGQRKKGGCKSVSLNVHVNGRVFNIPAKCDVRKSFSNRSFAQYYDRSAYAVIPLDVSNGLYLTVSEAVKGRDGKFFVAMEKSRCSIDQRATNQRHPLLAFASESVYRVVIHSTNQSINQSMLAKFDCRLEAKCLFQQGAASVVVHRQTESKGESAPISSPARDTKVNNQTVKVKIEPTEYHGPVVASFAPSMGYSSVNPSNVGMSHMRAHAPIYYQPYTFNMYAPHQGPPTVAALPSVQVEPINQPINQPIKSESVLGKRRRQSESDAWFESKHACLDSILPNQIFPLALDQELHQINPLHKVESFDSMTSFMDSESGCASPLSPFNCDTDDCFSPSSPFSDSFSDDLSASDEYDSIFPEHVSTNQSINLPLSPFCMPLSSPFSQTFSNWEPFHVSEFTLQ